MVDVGIAQEAFAAAVAMAARAGAADAALTLAHQGASSQTPMIHLAAEDILPSRRRLARGLADFAALTEVRGQLNPLDLVGASALGYYVIYNGYEDLYLRQLQAAAYWAAASLALEYTAPFLLAPPAAADGRLLRLERRGSSYTYAGEQHALMSLAAPTHSSSSPDAGKLRVGFASSFFYRHSVGLLLRGVITGLAARRGVFSVHVLSVRQQGSDAVTQQLREAVGEDRFHVLSGSLSLMRSKSEFRCLSPLALALCSPTYALHCTCRNSSGAGAGRARPRRSWHGSTQLLLGFRSAGSPVRALLGSRSHERHHAEPRRRGLHRT